MPDLSLEEILGALQRIGACMCDALAQEDFSGFSACVDERAGWLAHLESEAILQQKRRSTAWHASARVLVEQDVVIRNALKRYESGAAEEMQTLQRFNRAQHQYEQTGSSNGLLQGRLEA